MSQLPSLDVLKWIPQRPPFVFIDELLTADGQRGRSRFTVRGDNPLLERGRLAAAGLVENMAQTAGAWKGYICEQEVQSVPVGYIGAVQRFSVERLPELHEQIETEIFVKNQIFDAWVVAATIYAGPAVLARGELKIFIPTTINS